MTITEEGNSHVEQVENCWEKKNKLILVLTVLTWALLVSSAAVFAKYDTYAGRFTLEEIAEYKPLPKYNESQT